ncbi:helix-turn-helix domain-containing protein [Methylobacterium sp. EM32]|uniref:helix-turn-helix domain-containing protein n=1 Tax=Methylobacterium sp. EM32 TaxID=3163481 RepID=UPI0033A85F1A
MPDDDATIRRKAGLRFSTDVAAQTGQDGFEAYHDLYASAADVGRLDETFAVEVTAERLDGMILFDRRLRGVAHARAPRRVLRDGFDHFTAQLVLGGALTVDTPGGSRVVAPGEIALIDMSRPMETRADRARVLTLSIPRAEIETVVHETGRLHGAIVPQDRARLLALFLGSILDELHGHGPGDRQRLARATSELLALTLSGLNALGRQPAGPSETGQAALQVAAAAACRRRARHYIDAHLATTPDAVARAIGVSRSVLYRAFEPSGGVARAIRSRRLARLRSLLVRPDETARIADLALASGFSSESDGGRAFKAAFGLSPGAFRRLGREACDTGAPGPESFADWWNSLR